MKVNRAIITGITGQDGSYLAEQLLEQDFEVWGVVRRSSTTNLDRISHLLDNNRLHLASGDVMDYSSIAKIYEEAQPTEIYHLAAMSHVGLSFNMPQYAFEVASVGTLNMLCALKEITPWARLYHAGSSEMWGTAINDNGFQDETTPFEPCSPYAAGKVAAHNLVRIYRKGYGLHCVSGICLNHESRRRGENFVTRKVTKYIGNLVAANVPRDFPKLVLGNLEAKRDWGYAPDFCRAFQAILRNDTPEDFVVGTGETYSIRDFLEAAFDVVHINWEQYVTTSNEFTRPFEVPYLRGDASLIREKLGWKPSVDFYQLVELMVANDLRQDARITSV